MSKTTIRLRARKKASNSRENSPNKSHLIPNKWPFSRNKEHGILLKGYLFRGKLLIISYGCLYFDLGLDNMDEVVE